MCSILSKTHGWVLTYKNWSPVQFPMVGKDSAEWERTLILQCRHCSARKKIVTRVTY